LPPKKAKEFVEITAKKLEMNQEFVQDVIDFYWKEVRKSLSELRSPRIVVANFGSFQIKHWKLEEQKTIYEAHLRKYNPEEMTFQKHKLKEDAEKRLACVNKVLKMVESDTEKRKTVKQKRYADKTENNMEEPKGDIPGNQE
jgi:nucleoid DNA-binding protein